MLVNIKIHDQLPLLRNWRRRESAKARFQNATIFELSIHHQRSKRPNANQMHQPGYSARLEEFAPLGPAQLRTSIVRKNKASSFR